MSRPPNIFQASFWISKNGPCASQMDKFAEELEKTLLRFDDPTLFDVSETYSAVYPRFLTLDHSDRPAIRGQLEGPISFGFNIIDQDERPIIFDDTVRPFMLEFMAKADQRSIGPAQAAECQCLYVC